MAARTVLWEIRRLMRRIGSPVVIGLVAVPAVSVRQAVIVVHVALGALQTGMSTRQRKAGAGVVKGRAGPVCNRRTVAHRAILREACGLMRRVGRSVEIREMARDACAAGEGVIVIEMAGRALLGSVQPHQSEAGGRV